MRPGARGAWVLGLVVLASFGLERMRSRLPSDEPTTIALPQAEIANIELGGAGYVLELVRSGDGWRLSRGGSGAARPERVERFFSALRTIEFLDVAASSESESDEEALGLGTRRFEIRLDDANDDRRILGIAVGSELVEGRRAIRLQGGRSAFWTSLWTEHDALPFLDPRYWLDPDQPLLCFDDPKVLEVQVGPQSIRLRRQPGFEDLTWWVGPEGSETALPDGLGERVEKTAWSLTLVPGGEVLALPLPGGVERALADSTVSVRWVPENAAAQAVTIGALPDGRTVARAGPVVIVAPGSWGQAIAGLVELP